MMIGQISSEAERASEKTAEAAEEMNSVVTSSAEVSEINKKIADSAKEAADSIRSEERRVGTPSGRYIRKSGGLTSSAFAVPGIPRPAYKNIPRTAGTGIWSYLEFLRHFP